MWHIMHEEHYMGGIPPVAAHLCVSVETIGGRAGLVSKIFSMSSQLWIVILSTCCNHMKEL